MNDKNLEQGTTIANSVKVESEIEELEEKIAPGRGLNHNETMVCG